MRGIMMATFAGLAVSAALIAASPSPALAQASSGCGITQAADAAVQRQIALLDAAKVDSSKFFNGANSCLGANLLDSLDLSNLIPTSFDFLGGAADQLINGLMQKAQQQVCQVLNDQLQNVVGKINTNMFQFDSLMGGQMNDLLGGSGNSVTELKMPNIPGLGQYDFTLASVSTGNGIDQPIMTPPAVQAGNNTVPGTGNTTTNGTTNNPFGNLFQQ
ncbi:hypothetical protein [Agrobacterium tumefaciens]|uniref:hypothetical protein n=1 Tax=Agrobacterium tumefaciens TaxID=358 RepID=UPI001573BAC7|nr:hypothetical protein [Agrobacterium tumefaciens]NSX94410.1 hypothetical protein [Agrobacterium tumefaciens]